MHLRGLFMFPLLSQKHLDLGSFMDSTYKMHAANMITPAGFCCCILESEGTVLSFQLSLASLVTKSSTQTIS